MINSESLDFETYKKNSKQINDFVNFLY